MFNLADGSGPEVPLRGTLDLYLTQEQMNQLVLEEVYVIKIEKLER